MKTVVWILIAVLVVLHQANFFHDSNSLVLGFLPATLVYHVGISLVAGVTWFLAVTFAWPDDLIDETSDAVRSTPTEGDA